MKVSLHKNASPGFSNLEAVVVILIMIPLSWVLVPALGYRMGWLQAPRKDLDIQLRSVKHPGISNVPVRKSRDPIEGIESEAEKQVPMIKK